MPSAAVLIARRNTIAWQRVAQLGCGSFMMATATAAGGGHGKEYSW